MKKKEVNNSAESKSQEIMINYLKGNNAELHNHETENALMNDPFTADAIEGLYGKLNPQELSKIEHNINHYITQRIKNQKTRTNKIISFPLWLVLLSVILLLISIGGYLMIRYLIK